MEKYQRIAKYLWALCYGGMAALFLLGAVLLGSYHLLFGGVVIAIIGAVGWVLTKGIEPRPKSTSKD